MIAIFFRVSHRNFGGNRNFYSHIKMHVMRKTKLLILFTRINGILDLKYGEKIFAFCQCYSFGTSQDLKKNRVICDALLRFGFLRSCFRSSFPNNYRSMGETEEQCKHFFIKVMSSLFCPLDEIRKTGKEGFFIMTN